MTGYLPSPLRRRDLLLLLIAPALSFHAVVTFGFLNWDDTFLVVDNLLVTTPGWSSFLGWFTTFTVNHYHPVTLASFALDHALAGLEPAMFHATNLLLHMLNTALVALLLARWVRDRASLLFAALLFGVHPLRTESVAWVSERKDLLAGFFLLLTVLQYLVYRDRAERTALARSVIFAALALLSKATAVVIPLLLFAADRIVVQKRTSESLRSLAPLFLLAAAAGVVAFVAQYSTGRLPWDPNPAIHVRLLLPFYNILFAAWKTLAPVGLSAFYPYPEDGGVAPMALLAASPVLVAALAYLVWRRASEDRAILLACVWFIITLAPTLQWTPVGRAMSADRFTYLPAIGLSLLAGLGVQRLSGLRGGSVRSMVRIGAAVVLAGLGTMSYFRAGVWKDSVTLWSDVIDQYPGYAEGYNYLGSAYATERGDLVRAAGAYTRSIELEGRNPLVHFNRGLALVQSPSADARAALVDFERAISLDPAEIDARVWRARILGSIGREEEAIYELGRVIAREPDHLDARVFRFEILLQLGRDGEAAPDLEYLVGRGWEPGGEANAMAVWIRSRR